jgi:hypothetical protein
VRRRIVLQFELYQVEAIHKFDRMHRAGAAAGLAERAIGGAGGEIGFDGVEGANLDALVAVDASIFHLAFGEAKQIAH